MKREILLRILSTHLERTLAARPGPVIIGLTGADASGKTRLASALATTLRSDGRRCQLVHVDDFHNPRAVRYAGDLPEAEKYLRQSFDFNQLVNEILKPIRDSGELERDLEHIDVETDTRSVRRSYHVDADTVVLIEGVFLLLPRFREFLDVVIFLDADDDTLVERAEHRDLGLHGPLVAERFRAKYLPAQRVLFAENQPERHAHLIIDNRDWDNPRIVRWNLP